METDQSAFKFFGEEEVSEPVEEEGEVGDGHGGGREGERWQDGDDLGLL